MDSVVNGWVARIPYQLFSEAGLEDVRLHVLPFVLADARFVEVVLNFPAIARGLVASGRLAQDEADRWLADLEERKESGASSEG